MSQKFATWYKPTLTIDWPQGFGKDSIFQNPAEALFFLLYHHKVGVTFDVLAINFGMARATAYSAIMRLKPILKTGLTDEGDSPRRVFSSKEDMEFYRSGDPV
ncbi:MAG: transposase family protein [Cytophagaceae bacterium]|nr:transposase family protein [Cytophagaceae bacterium]